MAMVNVLPFQPVLYDVNKIGNLGKVISPPYDQISEKLQEDLYNRHPYNFARLIFGKIISQDTEKNDRYTRAANFLESWLKEGILTKEEQPAFFAYEQKFKLNKGQVSFARKGFVGLTKLVPLGKGVLPHEKTFPKPKEDRLNLMRTCKANFEHVFFLYDDPEEKVASVLEQVTRTPPFLSCQDDANTTHTIWKISEKDKISRISGFLKERELLIADGHHRYETSLTYQEEMRKIYCSSTVDEAPFNFRLGTFVSLQDKGLVILPTHRVIKMLSEEQAKVLQEKLPDYFHVTETSSLEELLEKMRKGKHAFGLALRDKLYLLLLKENFDFKEQFPETPAVLQSLDVFLLHSLIFEQILQLPLDKLDELVQYVRWPDDAHQLVRTGSCHAAFFLNPARPEQVKAVAQAGEKMPHKSTDFYPKLWSGLLFYKMEF